MNRKWMSKVSRPRPDISLREAIQNENLTQVIANIEYYGRQIVNNQVSSRRNENFGITPLMLASYKGNLDIVRYLVEQGAQINVQNSDGVTALMYAVEQMHDPVVRYLLEQGADVDLRNQEGLTAMDLAEELQNMDFAVDTIIQLLSQRIYKGKSVYTPKLSRRRPTQSLEQAIQNEDLPQVIANIEYYGEDIVNQTFLGLENQLSRETPLILASGVGNLEIVEYLVEHGANLNSQDWRGNTPLIIAVEEGNVALAEYLIEQGANMSIQNNEGMTAWDAATEEEIIDLLERMMTRRSFVGKSMKMRLMKKKENREIQRQELLKKFTPVWRFLAEQGVFVVYKDGKGKRVKTKGKEDVVKIAQDPNVKAIVWSARSSDALDQFVDRLMKRKIKVTGKAEEYLTQNVMKITKKDPIYTNKDRSL